MGSFKKVLRFFNLLDRSGDLSITNIAVIVLITKMAIAPVIDWAVVGGLIISLLNYAHKRVVTTKAAAPAVSIEDHQALTELVQAQASAIEEAKKEAQEALDKAGKVALAQGVSSFRGR